LELATPRAVARRRARTDDRKIRRTMQRARRGRFAFDNVTFHDHFCGIGGNADGAKRLGLKGVISLNHDRKAIDTHALNHPEIEHGWCDISTADAAAYPSADILIASPECTNHTKAKGKKRNHRDGDLSLLDDSAVRSRCTMDDVVKWTAIHGYKAIVVENVIEIRDWNDGPGRNFDAWWRAILGLGYRGRIVYLNAQFTGVPQSRDRAYCVFTRLDCAEPDLDFFPLAPCGRCGRDVAGVQTWKKPDRQHGVYGIRHGQYVYRCAACGDVVEPYTVPARAALDLTLPSQIVGERDTALKPKTMQRLRLAVRMLGERYGVVRVTYPGKKPTLGISATVLPAQTGQQDLGLVEMPRAIVDFRGNPERPGGANEPRTDAAPLSTVCANGTHHGILEPAVLAQVGGNLFERDGSTTRLRDVNDPMHAVTCTSDRAVVQPPAAAISNMTNNTPRDVNTGPLSTTTTGSKQYVMQPPAALVSPGGHRGDRHPRDGDEPMPTLTTSEAWGVAEPPAAVVSHYGGRSNGWARSAEQPLGSVTCTDSHSVLQPPAAAVAFNGKFLERDLNEPLPTTTTVDRHGLLQPPAGERLIESFDGAQLTDDEVEELVMASRFRMCQPEELKIAHGFGPEYRLGDWSKRDQVKLIGNANPPNTIEVLLERVVEAIWG